MEQWLTRTEKNWIAGPYSKAQVIKMIQDGTLGLQDEVCPANGYWILLHERKEVFAQLGIEMPRAHGVLDEVTEDDILKQGHENKEGEVSESRMTSNASPGSSSLSSEEESEKPLSSRGWSFIFFGLGILVIIVLRVVKN